MTTTAQEPAPPAAYTVDGFCRAFGIGRTKTYELLACGKLPAKKLGKRTLILRSDAETWLRSLPAMEPRQ